MSNLLVFKASWCGPCKVLAPILEQAAADRNISYKTFDADENNEEFQKYNVRAVPTIIVVDQEANELLRQSGILSKQEVEILLDNL